MWQPPSQIIPAREEFGVEHLNVLRDDCFFEGIVDPKNLDGAHVDVREGAVFDDRVAALEQDPAVPLVLDEAVVEGQMDGLRRVA